MGHKKALEVTFRPSNFSPTIPFELLGEILSYISDDGDPLDLRYALLVCRSWYNATVHHKKLWTNIMLANKFLIRFRGNRLPHGHAFVGLCLSRSSPLPLRITVRDIFCTFDTFDTISLVRPILVRNPGELEDLFQRCKSLSWIIRRGSADINFLTSTLTSASLPALELPALECLTISDLRRTDELHGARFPRLPRLKEVKLINHSGRWTPFFHDDDLARAEKLTLQASRMWGNDDLICSGRFRSIRTLVLRGMMYYKLQPAEAASILIRVEFPLLETLVLHGRIQEKILASIEAPELKRMQFEENTSGQDSLVPRKLKLLVQPVEYLYVWFSDYYGTSYRIKQLGELIDEAPSLINVFVSPWMEKHMRKYKWTDTTRNLRFSSVDLSKQLKEYSY